MTKAFDKIARGMNDAIAFVNGDTSRARVAQPVDVKAVRQKIGKSQAEFAREFRLPVGTVRDWEQHRREPDTGSRVYLAMIQADPEGVQKILAKA